VKREILGCVIRAFRTVKRSWDINESSEVPIFFQLSKQIRSSTYREADKTYSFPAIAHPTDVRSVLSRALTSTPELMSLRTASESPLTAASCNGYRRTLSMY
jgi:hypothetical protein